MLFKPKSLTVPFVFKKLTEIAKTSGKSVGYCLSFDTHYSYSKSDRSKCSPKARKSASFRIFWLRAMPNRKRRNTSFVLLKVRINTMEDVSLDLTRYF